MYGFGVKEQGCYVARISLSPLRLLLYSAGSLAAIRRSCTRLFPLIVRNTYIIETEKKRKNGRVHALKPKKNRKTPR